MLVIWEWVNFQCSESCQLIISSLGPTRIIKLLNDCSCRFHIQKGNELDDAQTRDMQQYYIIYINTYFIDLLYNKFLEKLFYVQNTCFTKRHVTYFATKSLCTSVIALLKTECLHSAQTTIIKKLIF